MKIVSEYRTAVKSSERLRRSQRFRKKQQQQGGAEASGTSSTAARSVPAAKTCSPGASSRSVANDVMGGVLLQPSHRWPQLHKSQKII